MVKQGARRLPQSTIREDVRAMVTPSEQTKVALTTIIGLWPLLVVMGLMIGLLWSAGYQQP